MCGVTGNVSAARQADMDWARFIRPPSFLNELFGTSFHWRENLNARPSFLLVSQAAMLDAVGIQTLC
jgi:hypothetical protein